MKILITGANGMLAKSVKKRLEPENELICTDVADLDITDEEAVLKFVTQNKPDYIINCAAFTAVDKAETAGEMVERINADGPENLAKVAKENNSVLVHISTDYVFGGDLAIEKDYQEEGQNENYNNEEIRSMAFSELYTKAQAMIATLSACSVSGKILNSNELVELLYVAYNRDQAEVFGLDKALRAGYDDLYSTAPDVFEKKIKALDKQIEDKAIDLANEKIDKVQSVIQQRVQEKEQNMDSLISKMAELILEENKEYIGKDVAEKAIEEIKADRTGTKKQKGGRVNDTTKKERKTRTTK